MTAGSSMFPPTRPCSTHLKSILASPNGATSCTCMLPCWYERPGAKWKLPATLFTWMTQQPAVYCSISMMGACNERPCPAAYAYAEVALFLRSSRTPSVRPHLQPICTSSAHPSKVNHRSRPQHHPNPTQPNPGHPNTPGLPLSPHCLCPSMPTCSRPHILQPSPFCSLIDSM